MFYARTVKQHPWDIYRKFDLSLANRKHFECSPGLAIADHMMASAYRTENFVGVDRAVKYRLAAKKSLRRYCTERMPKV